MPTSRGMFGAERSALQAIPAPQTPFSLLGMLRGAGTGILDLMELGQTATRPEDIPPSAALQVPAVGGMFGAAFAPRGALASGAARIARPAAKSFKDEFSVDAFHGTGQAFDAFDLGRAGSVTDAGILGKGIYFTDKPSVASGFASLSPGGSPQVIPARLKLNNPLIVKEAGGKGVGFHEKLDDLLSSFKARHPNEDLDSAMLGNAKADFKRSRQDAQFVASDVTNLLRDKGHDGVVYQFKDGTKEFVVFEPNQVRSRFAKFDPAARESTDLLSANPATAAIPGMFGSMGPQQERAAILRGDLL